MSSLLAGELARLASRRLVRVLVLLGVASTALAGVLTFLNTEDLDQAELAARRRAAQARVEQCLRARVAVRPGGPSVSPEEREAFCQFGPGSNVRDSRFKLRSLKGILQGTTAPLVVVAWLVGASSIGADWQSRTLTTVLTWDPRRAHVLVAKALAAVIVAVVLAVFVQVLVTAALLPSAWWHGTTAGTGGDWVGSVLGVVLRGLVLVSFAAAVGFSVASVGRNTAAALGLGFAYFVVVENVVGNFLAGFRRWLLLGNAIVLVSGQDGGGEVAGRSVTGAALYLAAVAVALVAGAAVVFSRRDVA